MPDKTKKLSQTVLLHCQISGAVARALIRRIAPAEVVRIFLPDGTEIIAAWHDSGKISPTFQVKIRRDVPGCESKDLAELKGVDPDLEKMWGGHATVSALAIRAKTGDEKLAWIAGIHHGRPRNTGILRANDEIFGGPAWQKIREELLDQLSAMFGSSIPKVEDCLQARVIAGLTCVADWIASGDELSKLESFDQDAVDRVVTGLGFNLPKYVKGLTFSDIFGFTPNAVQQEITLRCTEPGIYVLEAPMGVGKTEAALFAAYRLLSEGKATGLYFALPTQATSDSIHARVQAFLSKILAKDSPVRGAKLLHSNAQLMEVDTSYGEWFTSSKRGLLASFGVGTIDQALMSALNVRFGWVRTYGLLGKVVVLDEVHSYDVFTSVILDQMIQNLRKLGCTVIILSATLTHSRRAQLLSGTSESDAYPLLTGDALSQSTNAREFPITYTQSRNVNVSLEKNDDIALQNAVEKARAGQQVLWIENTVKDAQNTYRSLTALMKDSDTVECGLLHSRFTRFDRARIQEHWLGLYGKKGKNQRSKSGRILVGTQILEQSLDIDADYLITRLCPTDMLLQRIGRLWRHADSKRPEEARPDVCILSAGLEETLADPKTTLGPTGHVYSPYVLCRTLEVWQKVSNLTLPGDIRQLIEKTYAKREECEAMQKLHETLCKRLETLHQLAQAQLAPDAPVGSNGEGDGNSEDAVTRYGQINTVEVLLLKSFSQKEDGVEIEFLDSTRCFLQKNADKGTQAFRQAKLALFNHCVKVPEYLTHCVEPENLLWLASYRYVSRKQHDCIRVGLIDGQTYEIKWPWSKVSADAQRFRYGDLGYEAADK